MSGSAPLSCIIYDLDGTLVDSAADITAAVNRLRESLALEPLDEAQVRRFVGDGARRMIERAVFGIVDDPADRPERTLPRSAGDVDQLLKQLISIYEEAPVERTVVVPGAEIGLRRWRAQGIAQVVLTNKPHRIANAVLEELGLLELLDVVIGRGAVDDAGNPVPDKPDPAVLDVILEDVGAERDETWVVGDGPSDVEFARACGIPCVTILGGYGEISRLEAAGYDPEFAAADFPAAMEILTKRTHVAV